MEGLFIGIRELKRVGNRTTFKRIGEWDPAHTYKVVEEAQVWEVMLIHEAVLNVRLLDSVVDDHEPTCLRSICHTSPHGR